jgi:hypothetical protein
MGQRLNRRRWEAVTRFLKSVVEDPKAKFTVRMAAAVRLSAVQRRNVRQRGWPNSRLR